MERIIAYCGLLCSQCGVYIATQQNDSDVRLCALKHKVVNCAYCPEHTCQAGGPFHYDVQDHIG